MVRRIAAPGDRLRSSASEAAKSAISGSGYGPWSASSCGRCAARRPPIRDSGRQAAACSPYPGGPGRPSSGPASPQLKKIPQKSRTQGDSFRGRGRSAYRGVQGAGDLGPAWREIQQMPGCPGAPRGLRGEMRCRATSPRWLRTLGGR
jgi:hypothetical protein